MILHSSFAFVTLVVASALTTACAHAQTATAPCPASTNHITPILAEEINSEAPQSSPPDVGGDYDESSPTMEWDISGATTKKFLVICSPHELGDADSTYMDVPLGSNRIIFTPGSGVTFR